MKKSIVSISVLCLMLQLTTSSFSQNLKRSVAIFDMQVQRARTSSDLGATMEMIYGASATGKLSSIGKNVSAQLSFALTKTNQFVVLERERIDTVIKEQQFSQTGLVDPKHAIRVGKMLGAQFGIIGTVTESNVAEEGENLVARFALQVKFVNTTTGEISEAEQSRVELKVAKGTKDEDNLLADAVNQGVEEVVAKLVKALQGQPFAVTISAVEGKELTLSAGQNNGLEVGQGFRCVKKGKELKDPSTGESLGFKMQDIGEMKITGVERKFSTAEITTGCKGIKVGDLARSIPEAK